MYGNSNFLLVLLVIGTSLATVNCQTFVTHFLCANPVNTMYVSVALWGLRANSSAAGLCGSRRVINAADLTQQCLQTYLSHIANYTTGPQTVWVDSTVTPCYPAVSPCPATARVICYGAITGGPTECPVQSIANGLAVAPSGRYYPSSVIFSCNAGYALNGNILRDCQPSGGWTGSEPRCDAYVCTAPTIGNGTVTGTTPIFTVTCDLSYKLVGDSTITCTNTNVTTTLPTCEPIICPTLMISNATLSSTVRESGTVVVVTCSPNFQLFGVAQVTCGNGSWSPTPFCQPIQCQDAPIIPNGYILAMNYVAGNVATVNCYPGYSHSTSTTQLKCTSTGSWAGNSAGHCTLNSCPTLTAPSSGTISAFTTNPYSIVTFGCNTGYTSTGSIAAVCQADSTWSSPVPTCNINACPMLTAPTSGTISAFTTTPYSVVTFGCNTGYSSTGSNAAVCQANGTWSSPVPTCSKITCPPLPALTNGKVSTGSSDVQSVRQYSCDPGFELSGSISTVCSTSGTWSATPPTCNSILCQSLPTITNSAMYPSQALLTRGSIVFVTCKSGYKLVGNNSISCQSDLSWTSTSCSQIVCTGTLANPTDGMVSSGTNVLHSIRTYTCNPGYQLVGNSAVTCLPSGLWSAAQPSCNSNLCSVLPTIANAAITASQTPLVPGSVAFVTCNDGYTTSVADVITCQPNASWSSVPCTRIVCNGTLVNPTNGVVSSGSNVLHSIRTYTCNPGYQLVGNSARTCLTSGTWSGSQPTCNSTKCSPLPNITSATVTASQSPLVPGSVAFVTCNTGFTAISGNVVTCQTNKSWTLATCSGITCPALTAPQNGAVAGGIAGQGQTRTFSCNAGYQITGQATVECQSTSAWSPPSPTCTKILTCPVLTIANGNLSSGENTAFTELTISCDTGYQLEGDSSIFCKTSGEWSYPNPACAEMTMTSQMTSQTTPAVAAAAEEQGAWISNTNSIVMIVIIAVLATVVLVMIFALVCMHRRKSDRTGELQFANKPAERSYEMDMKPPQLSTSSFQPGATNESADNYAVVIKTNKTEKPKSEEEGTTYAALEFEGGRTSSNATAARTASNATKTITVHQDTEYSSVSFTKPSK